jgi:uncharacterized protein YecE (DUF72 family)
VGNKAHFFGGLSGIQLPVPKYQFPPEWQNASRLSYYASFFNSIEINCSFYKIPLPRTISKWSDSVNDDFKFTFKLFKDITHSKGLNFKDHHLTNFFNAINHVGSKKGCILVQFPPSITISSIDSIEVLADKLNHNNSDASWNICFEFRHPSWYNDDLYSILNRHHGHLVRHDMPASATPFITNDNGVIYQRFHGPTGNYRGNYDSSFLAEYAQYIKQWLQEGKEIFVAFNNTAGEAYHNIATLNSFIRKEQKKPIE